MKRLLNIVESYRLDDEEEVKAFIEDVKANAAEEGYVLNAYSSVLKEKKAKGDVVDCGYLVKLSKVYEEFWD